MLNNFNLFSHFLYNSLFLLETFKALNGVLCADVPLRNYSLTHSLRRRRHRL